MYNITAKEGRKMQRLIIDQDIRSISEVGQEKSKLLSDVQIALNQLAKGEGLSHQKAKDQLLKQVPA